MNPTPTTLRCLAVDDEPHALKMLEVYIAQTPFLTLLKATTSPMEALEWIRREKTDLLFLDIQMEGLSGLQFLNITGKVCPVILTTAYSEYAIAGYEYQVADYLLKPYSFERFLKAVNQVYQSTMEASPKTETVVPAEGPDHIFVKGDAKNKFHRLALADICYVEGLRNYVRFHCQDSTVITLQNLKDLEAQLPSSNFIRVHRSYLINMDHLQQVEGNYLTVHGKQIPLGSSYRGRFLERIKEDRIG
jgi:DNA-binding LytR/AlgR family response regulator